MKAGELNCTKPPSTERRRPIFGTVCVALMLLASIAPFVIGPNLVGEIDIHLRYVLPVLGLLLVISGFVRRERIIWGILGILLTILYVGLHLVVSP